MNEKKFYLSKKFWAAVIIAVVGILKAAGVQVPEEVAYAAGAFLGAQALADVGKNKTQ